MPAVLTALVALIGIGALGCSRDVAAAFWLIVGALIAGAACVCYRHRQHSPLESGSQSPTQYSPEAYRSGLEALACAIAAKDSYSPPHIFRVQRICELIACRLGLGGNEIEHMRLAALLQDVGKLGVPDYILLKPGPLDSEEFCKVSNHAAIGAGILENTDFPPSVAQMVRHHHEKYDGTGYPHHLAGDAIPLGSRIISVAAVYEALISKRCYKESWSHHQALEHIERLSGSHFDPKIVDAFLASEPEIAALGRSLTDERSRAYETDFAAAEVIAQANRELVSLFEIAQTLSSTLEIDEVLALLAHRNRRLLHAATCVVLLADESRPRTLVARVAVGRHQEVLGDAQARLGKGVSGKAAARQRPFVGNYDPNDLTHFDGSRIETELRSCAVVPIVNFGEILGTINLYDTAAHAFSEEDVRLLTLVAQQASLAVKNARAFEKVRDSAMRDPLTNLHNGRYLRHALDQELSRAARMGESISVLGIDLDNFKDVNDLYGHRTGDAVLRDVAAALRGQLRDYDLVVRLGGDEFVVVLPGTPPREAVRTGERIRRQVARYAATALGRDSKLGASVGVASYPGDACEAEALLAQADAAMYRDKRARKQAELAA